MLNNILLNDYVNMLEHYVVHIKGAWLLSNLQNVYL